MEWHRPARQYAEAQATSSRSRLCAQAQSRHTSEGYEFGHPAVFRNIPPPTVTVAKPLRWYSLNRATRRAMTLRLRDRFQESILRVTHQLNKGSEPNREDKIMSACQYQPHQ